MGKKKRGWSVERCLRDMDEWLDPKELEFQREEPRRSIEVELAAPRPHAFGAIASNLWSLGLWASNAGTSAVLHGDPGGWGTIRLAANYYGWHVRLRYGRVVQVRKEGLDPETGHIHAWASRCLALSLALADDQFVDWCGPLLLASASNPEGLFQSWWFTPFYGFMARLYALWRCLPVPDSGPLTRLGRVYGPVLRNWQDDEAYSVALVGACEYHCRRTHDREDDDPEFSYPPLQVFPAEILAIQRVRRDLGAGKLKVSHALLDTLVATPPECIASPGDALLDDVIAYAVRELPELGVSG